MTANLYNVIDDIKQTMFPNGEVRFEVQRRNPRRWIVYLTIPHGEGRAKIEFLVDQDPQDPEDVEVLGSVLRHGPISRGTMTRIMDAIVERM